VTENGGDGASRKNRKHKEVSVLERRSAKDFVYKARGKDRAQYRCCPRKKKTSHRPGEKNFKDTAPH